MKRFSFFLITSLFLAGCGSSPSENPNVTSSSTQPMTEQSSEAQNSLCDIVSPQTVGNIVRTTLSVNVISPEDQPPLTCQYSGGGVQVTIMAEKGSDAADTHAMNTESIVAENRLTTFDEVGDGGSGFVFNDIVNGDVYEDDVWVNVSVESSTMTEEEKTDAVKELIDMVLVAL
ncbi:hypothetical protein KC725_01415 [Candidatus Peregrinibacteria bacterium]|nr:hypothetical protein [Candidatus Peregrinibacteria bacterium]